MYICIFLGTESIFTKIFPNARAHADLRTVRIAVIGFGLGLGLSLSLGLDLDLNLDLTYRAHLASLSDPSKQHRIEPKPKRPV